MSILGVMGPIMIGPSSSHTAGAARLGRLARLIYGKPVVRVRVALYNSFAETGKGHGTDRALVGGLLGMDVDDENLKRSLSIAADQGVDVVVVERSDPDRHPNSVEMTFLDERGESPFVVCGISLGGGSIRVTEINGVSVEVSGKYDMLLLTYRDVPGMVAFIGETLGPRQINIAYMHISRDSDIGTATALLKLDGACPPEVVAELASNERVLDVTYVEKTGGGYDSAEEN